MFAIYSAIDGNTDKAETLEGAKERADFTAEQLREAGANDDVRVWNENNPDEILYRGK